LLAKVEAANAALQANPSFVNGGAPAPILRRGDPYSPYGFDTGKKKPRGRPPPKSTRKARVQRKWGIRATKGSPHPELDEELRRHGHRETEETKCSNHEVGNDAVDNKKIRTSFQKRDNS